MDFLTQLEDNSILIVPNNIKNKIFDYINDNHLLLNIKIMSFDEIKKGIFFDYDNNSIYSLMNEYKISYSLAKSYLNDMYYLEEDSYDNKKLNHLLEMKNYLLKNNLLIINDLFEDLIKSKKKVVVYGFDYISKYQKHLLDKFSIKHVIIDKDIYDYEHEAKEASTMEEEVLYVAEEISKLIKGGTPLNKIFIAGINEEYDFTIRRIFKEYNIPFSIKNKNVLFDTAIAKEFFNTLDTDIESVLKSIQNKYDIDNNKDNKSAYNKLVNLVNDFYFVDDLTKVKELMIEEAKNTTLPSVHMENEILVTDIYNNIFNDDEYVFLMNFNMGAFPKVKKDEDYISDDIKFSYMETSKEYNVNNKNSLINVLKSIKNLTITYKLSSPFSKYYPSFLVKEHGHISFNTSEYSENINKLLFAKRLDKLITFGEEHPTLSALNNTYTIPYDEYDNSFKGISNKTENINYSYSNMSSYFKCPFRFYYEKVLYLDEFSKNISTFIGDLFHKVLEQWLKNPEIDIDEEYNKLLKENEDRDINDYNKYIPNNHDEYFIEKVRSELHTIIDIIKEQYKNISVPFEQWPEYPVLKNVYDLGIDAKINATIKGYVDKCIVFNNNIFIIDYKTGTSDKIIRDTFEFGLHIQLPLYMYLLETTMPEYNVAGIYLQHILNGNNKKDKELSQEEVRKNELKLDGISLDDENILKDFDSSYTSSEVIKSLKKNKDGSLNKKVTMTYEQKEEIKDIMKELITTCINNVYDSNFEIKPILVNGNKEDGCEYCSFRDVCYRKQEQYNRVTISKEGDSDE